MSLKKTLKKSKLFSFTAVLICIGFALTFLTSCHKDPMDTVWDGNYIYSGIYRCKTNGEDEEVLVKELSVEDKTYKYVDYGVSDYAYIGETLLFGASFMDDEENKQFFLIKYSIKDKTHKMIFCDTEFEGETYELSHLNSFSVKEGELYFSAFFKKEESRFSAFMGYNPQTDELHTYFVTNADTSRSYTGLSCVYQYENYLVLRDYHEEKYYSCNKVTGRTFVLDDTDDYMIFSSGYRIMTVGDDVFIKSVVLGFEKKIFTVPSGERLSFENSEEENGKIYFITKEPSKDENDDNFIIRSSIYVYDTKTEKLYNLTPRDPSDTKVYSFLGENLFVEEDVYRRARLYRESFWKFKIEKVLTRKNAKIYRFDENGNAEYLTNLLPNKKIDYIRLDDDGNIRYLGRGGIGNSDKIFNPETKKVKRVKARTRADEFMEYGVQCGDFYYTVSGGGWFSINAVRRFDKKTKKIVRVQSYSITPHTHVLGAAKIDLILPY